MIWRAELGWHEGWEVRIEARVGMYDFRCE